MGDRTMAEFKTAREAKRALYEEALKTGQSVRGMLHRHELRRTLSRHPVLNDVLRYFGGDAGQQEKGSAPPDVLTFGETCEELARYKADVEAWLDDLRNAP